MSNVYRPYPTQDLKRPNVPLPAGGGVIPIRGPRAVMVPLGADPWTPQLRSNAAALIKPAAAFLSSKPIIQRSVMDDYATQQVLPDAIAALVTPVGAAYLSTGQRALAKQLSRVDDSTPQPLRGTATLLDDTVLIVIPGPIASFQAAFDRPSGIAVSQPIPGPAVFALNAAALVPTSRLSISFSVDYPIQDVIGPNPAAVFGQPSVQQIPRARPTTVPAQEYPIQDVLGNGIAATFGQPPAAPPLRARATIVPVQDYPNQDVLIPSLAAVVTPAGPTYLFTGINLQAQVISRRDEVSAPRVQSPIAALIDDTVLVVVGDVKQISQAAYERPISNTPAPVVAGTAVYAPATSTFVQPVRLAISFTVDYPAQDLGGEWPAAILATPSASVPASRSLALSILAQSEMSIRLPTKGTGALYTVSAIVPFAPLSVWMREVSQSIGLARPTIGVFIPPKPPIPFTPIQGLMARLEIAATHIFPGWAAPFLAPFVPRLTGEARYIIKRLRARRFTIAGIGVEYTIRRPRGRRFTVSAVSYLQFEPKDPGEEVKLTFDATPDLFGTGVTLNGAPVVTVTMKDGNDPSPSAILNGTAGLDPTSLKVIVPVQGGLNLCDYDVRVKCATTDPQIVWALSGILPIRL